VFIGGLGSNASGLRRKARGRQVAFAFLVAAGFAGCSTSLADLEGFPCAEDKTCPSGFACVVATNKCMLSGSTGASDAGEPVPTDAPTSRPDSGTLDTGGPSYPDTSTSTDASVFDAAVPPDTSTQDVSVPPDTSKPDSSDAAVTCQGNEVLCGNVCANLASNAANCGACGRSCANSSGVAGTCDLGECVPETRAGALTTLLAEVASDGSTTVYQDQSRIFKCKLPTCSSTTSALYTQTSTWQAIMGGPLVIAGPSPGAAYFAATYQPDGSARVAKCSASGCTDPSQWSTPTAAPTALAGNVNWLYVAVGNTIYRSSHSSGTLSVFATAATGTTIKSMALSATDLFYFESGIGIRRCPLGSSTCPSPTKFVNITSGEHPIAVAKDANSTEMLYWVNNTTKTVSGCNAYNCSPVVTIAADQSAVRIAADNRGVYWGNQAGVGCCTSAGCAQTDLRHFAPVGSTTGASVVSMVSVGKDLVWTYSASGAGSLQRVTATP
jgi:hypothetical protein